MKQVRNFILVAVVVSMSSLLTFAQQSVSGTVLDSDGNPLPGVNVVLEGTSQGTTTDFDGNYQISAENGSTIVFSYIGFQDQLLVVGEAESYDIEMILGNQLSEVVVSALGSVKENRALGYSIQTVQGENIDNAKETNIINSLQGQIAGVQIQGSPSTLGGSSRITIRGSNSFLGNNQPLFVIDLSLIHI